ncbi:STS14 protein-like [Tasmannia lanceolata]|uniref:STS14 protein-like n=1 Tax=Tasmannia lanceolata TaxID=3420 RepID=UPI004063CE62
MEHTRNMALMQLFLAWAALAMCMGSALGSRHRLLDSAVAPNATTEFLTHHNLARAAVGVEPLTWSQKLATSASLEVRYQRDKKNCQIADMSSSKYGENQSWSGGLMTPSQAVELWVDEKKFYNHANNSCEPNQQCGVYTQVVWRKTLEVGCGQASCGKMGPSLTICLYDPPGNYVGESPY